MPKNTGPIAPLCASDCIILSIIKNTLYIFLIQLSREPFAEKWSLPGGLVKLTETLKGSACRHLNLTREQAKKIFLEQLCAYSDVKRDPRQRVVSIAFIGITRSPKMIGLKKSDAYSEAKWFPVDKLPEMAYDHKRMLRLAIKRIRGQAERSFVPLRFLPASFTLGEIQKIYEILLGHPLDKRNFRKRIMALGLVEPLKKQRHKGRGRPAELFKVTK